MPGSSRPATFSYHEPATALASRIQSHAKYSNFNLHEWIAKNFDVAAGNRVFDLGCGNGNYTDLFWQRVGPKGRVFGIDKNPDLIADAQRTHSGLPGDRVQFSVASFDEPFPRAADGAFDWIFAIYSLYYAEDIRATLDQVQSSLATGGRFVVIGPGAQSGKKLDEINLAVTGKRASAKNSAAVARIEVEFFPLFKERFGAASVNMQSIASEMSFPTPEEFAEYYWSTLLWRESTESRSPSEIADLKRLTIATVGGQRPIVINKQLACIVVTKG